MPKASAVRFDRAAKRVDFPYAPGDERVAYSWTRLPDLARGDRVVLLLGEERLPGAVADVVPAATGGVWEYDLVLDDGRAAAQPGHVVPARYLEATS